MQNTYCFYMKLYSLLALDLDSQLVRSIGFWKLNMVDIFSSGSCLWSPLEELFSITRLFSAHHTCHMPWVNTGSVQRSTVGVTLKGLTLWLPSWWEWLERLPTFNIWTFGTPPHHTISLNTSPLHWTPTCWCISLLHTYHAPNRQNSQRD